MNLSVVATLYQSAPHLAEFLRRMCATAQRVVGERYEIVLVNDGSTDKSLEVALQFAQSDAHLVVVDLSRNFGHHQAMMTGLAYARGDRIFLVDSDLEEEPEWLGGFSEQLVREGCDVVYGVQEQRKGGLLERVSGRLFWRLLNALTGLDLPENVTTARLMSRRYVDALLRHEEREIFIAGLWHITGFFQSPRSVRKHNTSESTYTLRRKIALLVTSVTSFSNLPLISIFYLGVFISSASLLYIAYLLLHWAVLDDALKGWTSVMASLWLLGGVIMSSLGIVGIYLSKIFSETKRRPSTIVRQVYGRRV